MLKCYKYWPFRWLARHCVFKGQLYWWCMFCLLTNSVTVDVGSRQWVHHYCLHLTVNLQVWYIQSQTQTMHISTSFSPNNWCYSTATYCAPNRLPSLRMVFNCLHTLMPTTGPITSIHLAIRQGMISVPAHKWNQYKCQLTPHK